MSSLSIECERKRRMKEESECGSESLFHREGGRQRVREDREIMENRDSRVRKKEERRERRKKRGREER